MNETAQRRYAEEIPDLPVTDWFDADVLPIRSGVFEVQTEGWVERATSGGPARTFRYFDGTRWYSGGPSPDVAFYMFQTLGVRVTVPLMWRGVTGPA